MNELELKKRFYISLVCKHVLFEASEIGDFLAFALENLSSKKDHQGYRYAYKEEKILQHILSICDQMQVPLTNYGNTYRGLLEVINMSESLCMDYLSRLGDSHKYPLFVTLNTLEYFLKNPPTLSERFTKKLYGYIVKNIGHHSSLADFLYIETRYHIARDYLDEFFMREFTELMLSMLEEAKEKSYKHSIEFVIVMFGLLNNHYFEKIIFYYAGKSSKMRYCLISALKKIKYRLDGYNYRSVRERCYFSSHFPIILWHLFARHMLKK